MKKIFTSAGLLLALYSQAQFTPNNIAVLKMGISGSQTAVQNADGSYAASIIELTTSGTPTATNIPLSSGTTNFVIDGRLVAHEGQLNLSDSRTYLTAVGYNAAPATTSSTFRSSPRVIARVSQAGTVAHTIFGGPTSPNWEGQGHRSAVTENGALYYFNAGTAPGLVAVRQIAHLATSSSDFSKSTGTVATYRSLGMYAGVLYGSVQAGAIHSFASDGTATPLPFAPITGTVDQTQFVFLDADPLVDGTGTGYDLLYVADRLGGIRKFYYNTTTSQWTTVSASGLYNPDAPTGGNLFGVQALTGRMEEGKPTLYATKIITSGGTSGTYISSHIVKVVDDNPRTGDWSTGTNVTASVLASTNNTELFRGVAFTPGSDAVLLPVNLSFFKGTLVGDKASLIWQTLSEINSQAFDIQRSKDGRNFETIGSVAANNTNSVSNYSFEDRELVAGNNYYRLRMIDRDGAFKMSNVIVLNRSNKLSAGIAAFPNPVTSQLTIKYPVAQEGASVKVVSSLGVTVMQMNISNGSTQTTLDVSALAKGQYFVHYISEGKVSSTSIQK